ncbi:metallophosphoesterase [Salinirubrum litoreum]|uniref:Metallophosphoesterase n=1 Tax=Salinirubrum litoreum TaxID=1126234 RepID=A0ABD5R9D4_9EURY|nr:metallophosphoesterase [Salinirubrum litoreum]
MAHVEPIPGEPAATADLGRDRALLVADYHAGIEAALRYERGVELADHGDRRRERLCRLLDATDADRLVVLGDLAHGIGEPEGAEREELDALFDTLDAMEVSITLAPGNHDGGVTETYAERLDVLPGEGARFGPVGLLHGHTWPAHDLLSADVLCIGHEHPTVRLEDSVGGSRAEKAWLRGPLRPDPFAEQVGRAVAELGWDASAPELIVFPTFTERSGGTWINVEGQGFLSPFLPEGLASGDAYLLDGTRLGAYRSV